MTSISVIALTILLIGVILYTEQSYYDRRLSMAYTRWQALRWAVRNTVLDWRGTLIWAFGWPVILWRDE